jgi:hypothetical protein
MIKMKNLNCKMQNEILKFENFDYEDEVAKKHSKIHSQREGENSQRGFGFKRAGKVDSRTLSKIFKTK